VTVDKQGYGAELIIRRADQESVDRYPLVPRYAVVNVDLGSSQLHVGDLTFLPGSSVPYHYHDEGAEETQIMLEGELECWFDGIRITVGAGDTVTAPPGINHAFFNRSDAPARMITAFPRTLPETTHLDDPELSDVSEHPAITRAGTRSAPYAAGVDGVERIELSGDFSGGSLTYTYFVDIQPGATMPVETSGSDAAIFVVSGPVISVASHKHELATDDAAAITAGDEYGYANEGSEVARLVVVHPFLNA
jgi:quercetin dioxygenase-like cupin family protein